jgi:hypothetical protein
VRGFVAFFAAALTNAPTMRGQSEAPLQVMPLPAHSAKGEGQFLIDASFGIALEPRGGTLSSALI